MGVGPTPPQQCGRRQKFLPPGPLKYIRLHPCSLAYHSLPLLKWSELLNYKQLNERVEETFFFCVASSQVTFMLLEFSKCWSLMCMNTVKALEVSILLAVSPPY